LLPQAELTHQRAEITANLKIEVIVKAIDMPRLVSLGTKLKILRLLVHHMPEKIMRTTDMLHLL